METGEIRNIALEAIKEMVLEFGLEHRFPFDQVWAYAKQEVESTKKPAVATWLSREGYIEKTGSMTRALAEQRAGSPTNEYRFGPKIRRVAESVSKKGPLETNYVSLLKYLKIKMENEGYIISEVELANFYLAVITNPLVILTGISGTGKSLLPRLFAKHTNSAFLSIPVQPQWSDNTDLFGYVPSLNPLSFVEGRFIEALRIAEDDSSRLVFVLLDEMNLAPVEYYFSDFLSVMETRRRESSKIITDPLPIDLPSLQSNQDDPYVAFRNLSLPQNIRIIGTANMDETTKNFSPKVLDRAFALEFDDPDLTAFASKEAQNIVRNVSELASLLVDHGIPLNVYEARPKSGELFDTVAGLLNEVQQILSPAGIKFGYRTRDAILMYLYYWKTCGLQEIMSSEAAIDFCLLQKLLPKIQGSGRVLDSALGKLIDWLDQDQTIELGDGIKLNGSFVRSSQKANRMRELLSSNGVTYFWGV